MGASSVVMRSISGPHVLLHARVNYKLSDFTSAKATELLLTALVVVAESPRTIDSVGGQSHIGVLVNYCLVGLV